MLTGRCAGNVNLVGSRELLVQITVEVVDLPPPLMPDDQDVGFVGVHPRLGVHRPMHPVDLKVGDEFKPQEEQHREHQQGYRQATDSNPCLSTADIDRHVVLQIAASLLQSDRQKTLGSRVYSCRKFRKDHLSERD